MDIDGLNDTVGEEDGRFDGRKVGLLDIDGGDEGRSDGRKLGLTDIDGFIDTEGIDDGIFVGDELGLTDIDGFPDIEEEMMEKMKDWMKDSTILKDWTMTKESTIAMVLKNQLWYHFLFQLLSHFLIQC